MLGLHRGHLRPAAFAGAALAVALTVVGALPATADTLGGDRLASPNSTVLLQPGADPLPVVRAATWILADAETGEVLAQKGSHVRRAPASTLKMLTALTVLPRTAPETEYIATPRAAYIYGARVGLKPGKAYTMDDLWYAVFLPSANDAAIAVAEANGGVRRTVRQMNDLAYELRALDTVVKNTNGLDAPGQLSSAYDLALIARAGLTRPDFAKYARTVTAQFPDVKGKGTHPIYTTNRLLLHGWRGAIGVKTGFTSQAGRTYVGAATRGGRTLIVTLMGIRESSEEAAKKLLKWGFANGDQVTPLGTLLEPGAPLPVEPDPQIQPTAETTDAADMATSSEDGAASTGTGTATTAASPSQEPGTLPVAALLGAAVLVAGAGLLALMGRRKLVRPAGRHAA
jgi:D-alanyl-D-alanine carboxypeptidase (penicillin-binding protein 5/6)